MKNSFTFKEGMNDLFLAKQEECQKDAYRKRIFEYAACWANLMEKHIASGEKLGDIAQATSEEADTDGITGFMYNVAVAILCDCWVHGEKLRVWHNLRTQRHGEGEKANKEGGVLNGAVFVICPRV
jgi:hypothetical protein